MSLTSYLRNPSSPVRRWMEARFPDLGEAIKALRVSMPLDLDARTIQPGHGVPPVTIVTAIDYRIRYHLAVTPNDDLVGGRGAKRLVEQHLNEVDPENPALWRRPATVGGLRVSGISSLGDPDLSHLAPAAFFQALGPLLAELQPVGRALDTTSEERLDRACAVLALFEEVFRTGRIWPTSPLRSLPMESSAEAVLALIPRSWTYDIAAVCTRLFAEVPLTGHAILNPTFKSSRDVGGADADLVLERCLLEIKATVKPRLDPMWMLQLLGYVLLDSDDACDIDAVGVLLARQGFMTRWPLDRLLDKAAGSARAPLDEMRADFAAFVSTQLKPKPTPRVHLPDPDVKLPEARPHPSTLETIGIQEAADLTGRSPATIRRAISDGRLAAVPPASNHPANYGSGFRLSRVDVEAAFPPAPEALHVCGQECDGSVHVSYISALAAPRQCAEGFLRDLYRNGAIIVEKCTPARVPVESLPRMKVEKYVRYGWVDVPPGCPWLSWRAVWRGAAPHATCDCVPPK